jgi:hypothetical protein
MKRMILGRLGYSFIRVGKLHDLLKILVRLRTLVRQKILVRLMIWVLRPAAILAPALVLLFVLAVGAGRCAQKGALREMPTGRRFGYSPEESVTPKKLVRLVSG